MSPFMRSTSVDVSARKTYDLIDEPVGADYHALLDCALSQCDAGVLVVRGEQHSPALQAFRAQLAPFVRAETSGAMGTVIRFALTRDSVQLLKASAAGLFAWHAPDLPDDLCLMRADASPWLVSISSERIGYVELSPFEKLLLGRAAPGLAAVLAHQAARDAILAYFERRLEGHLESLSRELTQYCQTVIGEGREGVVDAVGDWLRSEDFTRVAVALEAVRELRLVELRDDVAELRRSSVGEGAAIPAVYRSNLVLRERWKARHLRTLDGVLAALIDPAAATP